MVGIDVSRVEGVARVVLANPGKKNALDRAMMSELAQVLPELDDDPSVRVVVFTGADGDFCSGADLSAVAGDEHPLAAMHRINRTASAVYRMQIPTIAGVDGAAVGAGLNLALACDLVVASDRARFSQVFVRRGLSVDFGGSWILPRLVGLHRAKELCLLGEVVPAVEAAAIGLVNRVVPVEDLDKTVDDLARRLAAGPALALALTKKLLNEGGRAGVEEALDAEATAQAVNLRGADTAEAFAAFREKRDPRFAERL